MLTVGLTGGIGAGKSTVARRLAGLGAVVVDADQLARAVVEPGTPGLAQIAEVFGPAVLTADGRLDRAAMAAVVFSDPTARVRLEAVVHPRLAALTAATVAALPDDTVVVHDMPLLVEKSMAAEYHLVVVVDAPVDVRVARLADRGIGADDARARMTAQADDDARRRSADVWLDNAGPEDDVLTAVDRLWHSRLLPFHRNLLAGRCATPPEAVAPGQPADLGVRRRLLDRVRRACGATVAGHWDDDATLVLAVPRIRATLGGTDRQDVRRALGRAGFPPSGTHLHGSADPGTPVRILLADA